MSEFKLIESNADTILKDALNFHEKITGEKLPLCNKVTYLYSTVAALLANIKSEMNDVAVQNFLKFSRNERLDLKGAFYGSRGERLKANKGRTTIRCFISDVVDKNIIISKGTRFIYKTYVFATEKEYIITKGNTFVDVIAVAQMAGELEEILKGEIKDIVDRYEYFEKIEQLTDVTGDRNEENDEQYRKRLEIIPESFTTGGSEGAYDYWAKKASSLVTDTYIDSPKPNYIDIYVINGIEKISQEEKEKIKNFIINDKDIKVLNDQITIKDPILKEYNIDIEYWMYDNLTISKNVIEEKIKENLKKYSQKFKMGQSINLQDIIEICKNIDGVKRIKINQPQEYQGEKFHIPKCNSIKITYKGSEGL